MPSTRTPSRVVGGDQFEALYMDVLAGLPGVKTLTSQHAMKVVKRRR